MKSPLKDERAWIDELTPAEFDEYEKRLSWLTSARPEQLTPEGDWKTWLYLAGRGAGKTRSAAEDVSAFGLDYPKSRIAVVAETFADGRNVCIEGESGLLNVLPESAIRHWNRSLGELILTNGTRYKLYSGDKPNQLRGPQHHRGWTDELAKYIYADETWTQLQLGLRLGDKPQNVVTTTPRPIELIKDLVERDNVVITSGSTFDNAENLSDSFLDEVRLRYEGTPLGDQELFGKIVLLDGEAIFKRQWFATENRYDVEEAHYLWNKCYGRWASLDTSNKVGESNAYNALTVGDLQPEYTLPLRHVARERLEFPELVEWTIDELYPYSKDEKLKGLLIEDAASGTQLIQTLRRSGPAWLRDIIVPVKPKGKDETHKAASVWMKRGMLLLPHPHPSVPWLPHFEEELFAVPNTTYFDQADSISQLILYLERRHGVFSRRWRYLMSKAA